MVLRRIIEGNRVLQVCTGQGGVAQNKPAEPDHNMRLQKQYRILDALRELEALRAKLQRRLVFRAGCIKDP